MESSTTTKEDSEAAVTLTEENRHHDITILKEGTNVGKTLELTQEGYQPEVLEVELLEETKKTTESEEQLKVSLKQQWELEGRPQRPQRTKKTTTTTGQPPETKKERNS